MAHDKFEILRAHYLCGNFGYVFVTGTVRAVPPDFQRLIIGIIYAVQLGDVRHRAMEGRIEHYDVRHRRHNLATGVYAHQAGRHVQRSELDYIPYLLAHLIGNERAVSKVLAAGDGAMSDCGDFRRVLYDAVFRIGQRCKHRLHRDFVIGHILIDYDALFPRMLEK